MSQPENTFHHNQSVNQIIYNFSSTGISTNLSPNATPVSTTTHDAIIHVHSFHIKKKHCQSLSLQPKQFLPYMHTYPTHKRHALGYCTDLANLQELLLLINSSDIVFALDRSHHPRYQSSTSSCVISSKNEKLFYYGVFPVNGNPRSLNSSHSELETICRLLYWLRLLLIVG